MKNFIVAIMVAALIMATTFAVAGANGYNYYDGNMYSEGMAIQGSVTGIAVEEIDLGGYGNLGAGSVDIVGGQMMEVDAWGNGYGSVDNTMVADIDQTLEATFGDSSVVGTQDASTVINAVDNYEYYGNINMDGTMFQGGVTGISIDSLDIGPVGLGAGSIDAIGIQGMRTDSSSNGAGMSGAMDITQTLTVTTPNSTIIMNQNASCESTSVIPVI